MTLNGKIPRKPFNDILCHLMIPARIHNVGVQARHLQFCFGKAVGALSLFSQSTQAFCLQTFILPEWLESGDFLVGQKNQEMRQSRSIPILSSAASFDTTVWSQNSKERSTALLYPWIPPRSVAEILFQPTLNGKVYWKDR